MTTRKPVLPELRLTVECFPWTGVTDTRERTRAELRAAEAFIRAALALLDDDAPETGREWGNVYRTRDRLLRVTRPTRRTP